MSFEISQKRPRPKLWLAKPNKQIIQRLHGIENLSGKFNFMNENELTFNINSYVFDEKTQEQKKNPALSKIKNKYLLKFTYNGQEEWFIIDSKTNTAEEKDYIPITARYIGSELDQKQVGTVEEIGKTIRDMMNQFLPVVAKNWSVRYIDDKLANVQREYNLTDASIGSILAEISEQTDAVIVFHNKDRQLSFIHKDNAGRFRGLKVKETTYLKSFTDAQNSQDLVTRLILEGKEGLSINSVNPAGTSYIDDFSYYLKPFRRDSRRNVIEHSDYMSDDLAHALLDFNEYFENRQGEYEELSESYTKLLTEQLEEDFKLSEITATLNNLEERIEVLQPIDGYAEKTVRGNTSFNVNYNMHYMMLIYNNGSLARVTFEDEEHLIKPNEYKYIKIKTPKQVDVDDEILTYPLNVLASNPNLVVGLSNSSEADFEEDDIDELDKKYNVYKYRQLYTEQYAIVASIEKRVDAYNKRRQNINESLSVQSFFTPQLQEELENFTHWGIWREENHTDPKELLEDGREQLSERNNIDRTTTVNIIDFVQSLDPEDQKNWDKLVAGDKIRFSSETYEADLEAFISELNINFDDNDISLTLSDVIDLRDKARGASQVLASFVSTSNQVNIQKKQLDENAGKTNQVMALLEAEWDANKRRILAGNETVDIGSHGIRITSPTHPNEMLVAVAGVISISDDYGETFKQAINTRGVVAERLIGKVILGTELIMENNSGTFRFDDDGVRINAEHFHLIADDGQDYFENLMRKLEQEFVTYEERIKADMEQQEESFKNEMDDVAKGISEYTNNLLDALADGMLTEQEINMLKMQMNMLEADYAQARRRILPIIQSTDVDSNLQNQLYLLFMEFEEDYEKLLSFIRDLDDPVEVGQETIDGAKDFLINFKPNIEEIISLAEMNLEAIQNNRIANAEYNSRTFTENLMHDLEDEILDLNNALEGFDLGFEGAVADGVLDMVERANISNALLRVNSEKANVDNRYATLSVHRFIVNTDQLTSLQTAKQAYNTAFNNLINRINYALAREKITPDAVEEYRTAYEEFASQIVNYSQVYEESLEFVQNRYADTQRGEAEKYADGLKKEVDDDIADVQDNIDNFAEDVYGAFKDGIITENERNRLGIHRDMIEKEKSDVIERYNTIITSQYLQGFYDTEALVRARARYGEIHADLLLNLELAMMDDKITKEEADQAVANFEEYVERLTTFSVELELAIAALGESKAVYQTKEELKNYIELSVFNDEIAQIQSTLDGHIMTWYYDHEPTLNNEPAVNWTDSTTRERHVGDLFYYGEEGYAYRFMKQPNGSFAWNLIKDTDVTRALADAQDAIDLADSKRRVFVTTPTAPYDIGDLWIMGDGELMRARTARSEGATFLEGDWIKATKYTDDTKANAVENMLSDFQGDVNDEFEDLKGTFEAFRKTIEGAFKDGIIEEYELKILQTQAQSLDREKADVDALYNQLLNRSELISGERNTLVTRYNSFSSTHQTLVSGIRLAIEDGVISEEEYEATMRALDNYPEAVTSIKEYMNQLITDLINRVAEDAKDALEGVDRFDTWKSSSFEVDSEQIASRVGQSSWESTWLPQVDQGINDAVDGIEIGGRNLILDSSNIQRRSMASGVTSEKITDMGYTNVLKINNPNLNSYFTIHRDSYAEDPMANKDFTLSFLVRGIADENSDKTLTAYYNGSTGYTPMKGDIKEDEYSWVSVTFNTHDNVPNNHIGISSFKELYFAKMKVEIGNKATDWTPAPEDFQTQIDFTKSEIEDISEALGNFEDDVTGFIKDGIIEEAEAKAIKVHLQQIDKEKDDIDKKYSEIYGNSKLTGSAKTNLLNAKNSFNSAHSSLKTYITSAISDGKVTSSEASTIDSRFSSYSSALSTLSQRLEQAVNAIASKYASDAESSAKTHADNKAQAAQDAAEAYAKTKAEAERVLAEAHADGKVSAEEEARIADVNARLAEAKAHADTTSKAAEDAAKAYSDTEISKIEKDIENQFKTVNSNAYGLNEELTKAFKDGIISESEATAIGDSINLVKSDYENVMKRHTNVYANSGLTGTAKTRLLSARNAYNTSYNSLVNHITTVINSGKITSAQRTTYNTRFSDYRDKIGVLSDAIESAWDAIVNKKSGDAANSAVTGFYNTTIKSNYSTTAQTKELLGSYVTSTELQGNLDKISSYSGTYSVNTAAPAILREANNSAFNPNFSYEVTARVLGTGTDTLAVAVFMGTQNGSSFTLEKLEEKGVISNHPEFFLDANGAPSIRVYNHSTRYTVEVIYTKYAGAFTNLNKASSMIEQKAEEINLEVKKKVGNDEIISRINQSAEKISIDADKINISGSTINIGSNPAITGLNTAVNTADGKAVEANQKIDAIEVGGRNLILDSHNLRIVSGDGYSGILSFSNNENLIRIEAIGNKSTTANFYNTGFANLWNNKGEILESISNGDEYTLSMEVRYKGSSRIRMGFDTRGVSSSEYARTEYITDTGEKWVKIYAVKKETNRLPQTQSLIIGWFDRVSIGDYIEIRNIKLEKGNKATDWTPAPEDVDKEIKEVDGKATNAQSAASTADGKAVAADSKAASARSQADAARVGNNIVRAINDSKTTVNIGADRVNISGSTINIGNNPTIRSINSNVSSAQTTANTAKSDAGKANSKLESSEFDTVSKNYQFSTSISSGNTGKWYRIAYNTGNRAHGRFILRDTTSSQHGAAVFEAGIHYGKNPYINLTSFGVYSRQSFTKARILYNGTYDRVYLDLYITNQSRTQSLAFWLTDNIQTSGWVGQGWVGASIPSGYNSFERDLNENTVVAKVAETADSKAVAADSKAQSARGQADAARVGNNIVNSLNSSATTVNISADKINLSGYATFTDLSTSGRTTISGDNITTGRLTSSNGRTTFNLNTGSLSMDNADFELAGGAKIQFLNSGNRIVYARKDPNSSWTRYSGIGVGTNINSRFPYAYLGTTAGGSGALDASDDQYFTGFITNTNARMNEDDIGNSVVGNIFQIRDESVGFSKGFTFNLKSNSINVYLMNTSRYEYNLGSSTNMFRRFYVRSIYSNDGLITLSNASSSYTNQGVGIETVYGSDRHLHFRKLSSSEYVNLGKSSRRFSYVYLNYQPNVSSDARLKERIHHNKLGLNFIDDIETKSFYLINNNPHLDKEPKQFGIIAQQLNTVLEKHGEDPQESNIITKGEDGMYGVQYTQLIAPTIKAIQDLNKKVSEENEALKEENELLKNRLDKIEEMLLK